MKLTMGIQDALVLRSMLLEMGGGYAELVLAKAAAEQVFSTKDVGTYKVRNTPEGVFWQVADDKGNPLPQDRVVELGPEAHDMIVNAFSKLNEAKALKQYHLALYEQFVKPTAA